ncbi:MAG: ATP-binding protein [Chitinophagales bacterium]
MPLKLLFVLFCFFFLQTIEANSTYTFGESFVERVSLGDSIGFFLEVEKQYQIEDLLHASDTIFAPIENKDQKMEGQTTVWSKVLLINKSTQTQNGYFSLCSLADSGRVYAVINNQVVDERITGNKMPPTHKSLPSTDNYVPFQIRKGEQILYYFKVYFHNSTKLNHIKHIFISPAEPLVQNMFMLYIWNFFYAGMMLLFSFVGLLMFWIFREKTFVYFTLLTFFFAVYFLQQDGILETFFFFQLLTNYTIVHSYILSGLFISTFLFLSNFIQLQSHFPRYYRLILAYTIFIAIIGHILNFSFEDQNLTVSIYNLSILPWMILIIIPIYWLARQKNDAARILLFSLSILFFALFIYILNLSYDFTQLLLAKYAFQVGTILFSGILFYSLFDKVNKIRDEKRHYEELDQMKSRFFANISHEFRTPLTLVLGPIGEVITKQKNDKNKSLLQMAEHNAQRLLELINQLLDLSKLEAGKMKLKASEQNLTPLLKGITMSFESYATRKDIRLHFASQKDDVWVYVDVDKIEKIFYNLLSNALKFTNEQGEIAVLMTEQKEWVEIQVQDSGIGISASRLPHIFNRFYQVDNSETREQEGTGIGLALVKELVELHRGKIDVKSTPQKGTTFTLLFHRGKQHLTEHEVVEYTSTSINKTPNLIEFSERDSLQLTSNPVFRFNKKFPTVLVIEDHADVRAYIKQYLVDSFHILEAINGQDGIEKALEHLPDLIISDVMMPKKNGYEVCQTLKTDQRTSHIPIILLTAKAAQEEKIEGLEIGADDYLVKPFDTQELEVRVRNLIAVRRQLRKSFADAPKIEPEAIQTNSVDKAFLEKICNIIEANLSNEQFSVEMLVEEVGMSRSQINRKLKALTDESANKFIRSLRLQKAAEMLRQKVGNVSEIAFETGFSSTSYFTKCFRDKYGTTPGNYLTD